MDENREWTVKQVEDGVGYVYVHDESRDGIDAQNSMVR